MRARSWFVTMLGLILFSLCLRVWADALPRQALYNVYLPVIMRGRPSAVTPTASPTATTSVTPLATFTASPSASLTRTPANAATATPTRTATPTLTPTSGPSPTTTLTPTASPTSPCVAVATLITPTNGAALDTLAPSFRFDAGIRQNTTRYEFQISQQDLFTSTRFIKRAGVEAGVNSIQLTLNLDPATLYYWRVRLQCGEALAPWSETWSFTTGSDGSFGITPIQISPVDGALLTSWPVSLTWEAVPGAIEYFASWRKAEATSVIYGMWTTATGTLSWGLGPGTLYEWSVGTRNAYGIGPKSGWWRFTTPSTPPAPEHVFPRGGRFSVNDDGSVLWETD